MPAFAHSEGGMLTDQQIDVLVHGIRAWAQPICRARDFRRTPRPPGMRSAGAAVYATFCASCHGPDGAAEKEAVPLPMLYLIL